MNNAITIGKTPDGNLELDVDTLMQTRLLIQANSGGGKSFLIRRLAEQLFGKVPVIILDPEGEFATLREKFGYVLVGKGGETPADIRSAAIVAHKLLELRASAVCDLYEMKPQARHQWVRAFLDAMIDAPKELWGPTVIVVDEAHQYAPEGKAGESEASSAMVDLATRGRKRGFCAVFATQRLGKLRKDAAAELLNVMVGMTFIDIDRERAAECLGVSREDKHKFNDEIKLLTAGHFYCLGRAICKERRLVKVGDVKTTHPEAGGSKFSAPVPPSPAAIKSMLPKLADLPKQAEEKLRTEGDLRKEIVRLKTELTMAQRNQTPAPIPEPVSILTEDDRKLLNRLIDSMPSEVEKLKLAVELKLGDMMELFQPVRNKVFSLAIPQRTVPARKVVQFSSERKTATAKPRPSPTYSGNGETTSIGGGMRRMMIALAQRGHLTKRQLGVRAGLSSTSGTFGTYMATLRSNGWIETNGDSSRLTQAGVDALGSYEPLPEGQELYEYWLRDLGSSGAARILQALFEAYPKSLTKEELGEAAQISHASGTFGTYLSKLRTLELIEGRGELKASDEFFQ